MDGRVSVVTPCYNGEKYLAQTIQSVLDQTYADWELLVVDDGSTDRSAAIVRDFAEKDSRIKLLSQRNGGSASARNHGIREASGRYIALLDADDLWDPSFLEGQLAFLRQKDAVCVCCAYRHIDEHSNVIQHPTKPMPMIRERDMRVMNRVGCLTGLYDTARYGKVYLHEELKSIRDDYAYWYDIIRRCSVAYGNPRVLASYRVLSGSTTGKKAALVSKQYRFYRDYLKLNAVRAALNTIRWGVAGVFKFI